MRLAFARYYLLLLLVPLLLPAPAVAQAASKVTLELEASRDGAPRGGLMALDAFAHIAEGWHINGHKPNQKFLIPTELTLMLPAGVTHEPIEYPPPDKRTFEFAGDEILLVYEGKLGLATALRVPADYAGDHIKVEATLRYQACNDTTCLPPATARAELDVPVTNAAAGVDDGGDKTAPAGAAGGMATGGGADRFARWLGERGLVFTLLAVALLGLGLNLTPCVYPLISVTIAYFGGQARGRREVSLLAIVYVLGIAVSFSALGVAAALSGGLFGQALQKPAVVLFISGVMVLLALSSFGVYQFQPPSALMRWAGGSGRGAAGALFMGLTMGIVAAPCVGPIVVGLLVFVGSRQDPVLGFSLFFALALGMGAPYVVLAAAAGSMKQLPRSGEWLLWTERLFGCVLLSLAAYFVAPILPPPVRTYLFPAAVAVSGLYLGFLEAAGASLLYFPAIKRAVGLAMVGLGIWIGQPQGAEQAIAWEPLAALDAGADGAAKPLLIDFAAEWCIPCREMDHTTYIDADILREAERFRMVKVDITEENDVTTQVVARYEVRGVPTVILFSATGDERQRLVGYVGPDELLEAMRQVD